MSAVTLGLTVSSMLPAMPASAQGMKQTAKPTAIVSLGDSFIAGNAGRWRGNADPTNLFGDIWGTDRAAYDCNSNGSLCRHDPQRVYGPGYDNGNGCYRADSAEILNTDIAVDRKINIACSGAETVNVAPTRNGGQSWKGQPPQGDQLADIARDNTIKMVVLNIGGNDMGFRDIITNCVETYLKGSSTHCKVTQEPVLAAGLAKTLPRVRRVVRNLRAVMTRAGYADGSYRFVLQSYPSPVPPGAQNRYPETYARFTQGGCPVYNDDSDWVNDSVVPRISGMVQRVANRLGVDFLDTHDLFAGHEVCAKASRQASRANSYKDPLPGKDAEWARFLVVFGSQGTRDESVHPNYYGQIALGACLAAVYGFTGAQKTHVCRNTPGHGPKDVQLTSTSN
ncbi:MAG TPA: GDSL-type esterase/lipase family protein [Streptosporangiaceae bacterium]